MSDSNWLGAGIIINDAIDKIVQSGQQVTRQPEKVTGDVLTVILYLPFVYISRY